MSSKQTAGSSNAKVQIPDGWSPTSGERKMESPKPDGEITNEQLEKFVPEDSPDTTGSNGTNNSLATHDTIQPEDRNVTVDSLQTEPAASTVPAVSKRTSGKQRKESLEEYRQTFLTVPKLEDRKPVFISCEVRDRLDEIARKLGGRKMSVSGLIENLARHHLETYWDEVELWKKL